MTHLTRALIVDDERNIRITLRTALEAGVDEIDDVADGPAAVERCAATDYDVVLLDLRLPTMDGIEVLRRVHALRPETQVILMTAHGGIDAAVEAMRIGASDFLQKPFAPDELRARVERTLALRVSPERRTYPDLVADARTMARAGSLDAAGDLVRKATSLDPGRPEALHLLGVLLDLRGDWLRAQAFYRAALALDPTYRPSERNLDRSVGVTTGGSLLLGDEDDA